MIRYALLATTVMLVLSLAVPTLLAANEIRERDTRNWEIYDGTFISSVRSKVAINGESATPTPVDVEEALVVEDSKTVPWGRMRWDISGRHSLGFAFFRPCRDGHRGFDGEEIEMGTISSNPGPFLKRHC